MGQRFGTGGVWLPKLSGSNFARRDSIRSSFLTIGAVGCLCFARDIVPRT